MEDKIKIRGARVHNLKDISIDIPRDQFVVLTGLSGSGKSSLAFDTIYAEGQRRYVESLSSYARMFLGRMQKPDVDSIDGLSPSISIDQKTSSHNPRSTVGTATEIYDYLRLLFARVGQAHCPRCGRVIAAMSIDQICEAVLEKFADKRSMILAPLVRQRKGTHKKVIEALEKQGFLRLRVDGELRLISDGIQLDKNKKHDIDVVIDRLVPRSEQRSRLSESIEQALKTGDDICMVAEVQRDDEDSDSAPLEQVFSQRNACPDCQISLGDLSPQTFSFNSPQGACPRCTGLGAFTLIDASRVIEDPERSLNEGAIRAPGFNFADQSSWARSFIEAMASHYHFSLDTPYIELGEDIQNMILYGNHERIPVDTSNSRYTRKKNYKAAFKGVIPTLEKRYEESQKQELYEDYLVEQCCPDCHGARLRPEALAVTVAGKNIDQLCRMSLEDLGHFFDHLSLELSPMQATIASKILSEIQGRLHFLLDVGLDYLSLSRASSTLSGGESQRIRLATQIGSGLVGVLYILDEPSIGLHQRDNRRLLNTLKRLRDLGNSVLVVEHDEETMQEADFIVDMGPGAGEYGGEVVAAGSYDKICADQKSITGQFLSGRERIRMPSERRKGNGHWLKIRNAYEHNLKHIDVDLPLGKFICVTGVSGSGKSSLVNGILLPYLSEKINGSRRQNLACEKIEGIERLDKIIAIDQSPIGRTPRSNPATYTGVFTAIRELFAQTNEAKAKAYGPGRFSFNVKGGRCEACGGDGVKRIEMQFLPDVYVECDVCHGHRYNRETLEIKWKGKSISDVLNMSVSEALEFFAHIPAIRNKLQTLYDVGLSYIRLGQPSPQLSGGEAQRVKLASELSKRSTGRSFYILDEPSTGLHMADVKRLIEILNRLVDSGNTVVVIEHNLEIIKCADYIVDLGPEGGDHGGELLAMGSPEEIAQVHNSYTGQYLAAIIDNEKLRDEAERSRMEN
ncbi:MAG: excinuclease ABC subunit UvrA [Eubacteriales bacterium]|nr:excinuclease ABC subunit UvrA [Eubacteriales bacterium]